MFWKKKNDNTISIELDSDDRRDSIRIKPLDEIIIHHEEQQFKLIDISFSGLAFHSKANLYAIDKGIEISMSLPLADSGVLSEKKLSISCLVKVIHIHDTIYHCRFISLKHQDKLLLEQFILNEQKRQIHCQKH